MRVITCFIASLALCLAGCASTTSTTPVPRETIKTVASERKGETIILTYGKDVSAVSLSNETFTLSDGSVDDITVRGDKTGMSQDGPYIVIKGRNLPDTQVVVVQKKAFALVDGTVVLPGETITI